MNRLLAKSYPGVAEGAEPPRFALLVNHSRDVPEACYCLADLIGAIAIGAAGFELRELPRFKRALGASGWMQDIGKANDHFLRMVTGEYGRPQLIRHEAVSLLLLTKTPLREWFAALGEDALAALWGAVGHHRKFNAQSAPARDCASMTVFTSHSDFQIILAEMARDLSLPQPPRFATDLIIGDHRDDINASSALHQVKDDFEDAADSYRTPMRRRFVALVKAFGIAADVAASAIPRKHTASYCIADLIRDALAQGCLGEADLQGVIEHWAAERKIDSRLFDDPQCRDTRVQFQRRVAASTTALTLVAAGCGSGKSLAAYLWTKEWARRYAEEGREQFRLIFCLPTTGTATEHFKDYALEIGVVSTLAHSRASIDLATIATTADQEESDAATDARKNIEARNIGAQKIEAIELWSTPITVATIDTVLGLMGNTLRSLCASPAILSGAIVFDEIHALDESMFGHLLVFLANFPQLPVLLMTASLQPTRLAALRQVRDFEVISGPPDLEELPRYLVRRIESADAAFAATQQILANGGKVLWVANRVDTANSIYQRFHSDIAQVYHSRFRYSDRSRRHREVIDAFAKPGPSILVATQVAEMSLDLSADLLVTDLAPIPALIQRFGRLNRRATPQSPGTPKTALVLPVPQGHELPYARKDLDIAERWLEDLIALGRPASQRDLVMLADPLQPITNFDIAKAERDAVFLSGLWRTEVRSIRTEGHTISVILEEDWDQWKKQNSGIPRSRWLREHEVAIPLKDDVLAWRARAGYLPIAPSTAVQYDWDDATGRGTGAAWRRN